jgi:hypothetical protein
VRTIVNFASGRYIKGQARLRAAFPGESITMFTGSVPRCPDHSVIPYAFKPHAMKYATSGGYSTLLWCDACIMPGARPLSDLWEKIERDGAWIANNGFTNYEWTADSAYPDLFPVGWSNGPPSEFDLDITREVNRCIPHVVATAFGISLAHPLGRAVLNEYYRLANTNAFCGPWRNSLHPDAHYDSKRSAPCGPADVRGHRHDQTALSVIAWRLGVELTNCPEWFAYKGGETEATCLVADGDF